MGRPIVAMIAIIYIGSIPIKIVQQNLLTFDCEIFKSKLFPAIRSVAIRSVSTYIYIHTYKVHSTATKQTECSLATRLFVPELFDNH